MWIVEMYNVEDKRFSRGAPRKMYDFYMKMDKSVKLLTHKGPR